LTVTVAYLTSLGRCSSPSLGGSNRRRLRCLLIQGGVTLDGLDGAGDPVLGLDAAAEGYRPGPHGPVGHGRLDGGGQAVNGSGWPAPPAQPRPSCWSGQVTHTIDQLLDQARARLRRLDPHRATELIGGYKA
jgi:hypothetical protein